MTRQAERTALRVNTIRLRFQKENLQSAREFYEAVGAKLGRPNSKGWAICYGDICPVHRSKSRRSFSVNIIHGGWQCFGCDQHGDMVKFVMLRDNCDFSTACKRLGAWDGDAKPVKVRPGPSVRFLVLDFTIDNAKYHTELWDEPSTELQLDRRFYADAKDRLTEIRNGDAEIFEGEEETQWGILATSWELIQMEVADGK